MLTAIFWPWILTIPCLKPPELTYDLRFFFHPYLATHFYRRYCPYSPITWNAFMCWDWNNHIVTGGNPGRRACLYSHSSIRIFASTNEVNHFLWRYAIPTYDSDFPNSVLPIISSSTLNTAMVICHPNIYVLMSTQCALLNTSFTNQDYFEIPPSTLVIIRLSCAQ